MAQCTSSPTLTSIAVGTTQSVSTTVSRFVTAPPGSVFTTLIASCSTVSNTTTCATATRVVTQTATPFTTEAQVAVTVNVPYSHTTTLYASSCSTPPGTASSSFSSSPVVSTVTSSSIYTSDGSTYVTVVTSLSSADPAQSTSSGQSSPSNSNNSNIPAIIGGAFGGLCALALLAIFLWKFLKKQRISFDDGDYTNFNEVTKQEQGSTQFSYSPVAQQDAQPVANAFSNTSGYQPAGYGNNTGQFSNGVTGGQTQYAGATGNGVGPTPTVNETGLQPGVSGNDVMYNIPNHGPVHQIPVASLAPLAVGAAALASAGPNARRDTTTIYTPGFDPTAGQQISYPNNMGYVPQQYPSRQSGLAGYPQPQAYGLSPQQRPLSHNLSVGSTVTTTTSSGPIGSSSGPSVNSMPTLIGQVYPQHQHQQSFGQQSYGDTSQSVSSAGSVDNRVLQVRNPGQDSLVQDSSTAYSPPGHVEGPSSSASSPSPFDGKGRPLDMRGEKATMVHLDGGAYSESPNPAPPAYRE